VLRFAPIYDSGHLQDVAKRVFLPGTRVKLRLCPPPVHSLCSLDRAVQAIVSAAETASPERQLENMADATPTNQHDLLDWFPGSALPVPTSLLSTLASAVGRCGTKGRKVSRLIDKFVRSSIYPEPDWKPTLAWPGVSGRP
jgi:hypothetical protein